MSNRSPPQGAGFAEGPAAAAFLRSIVDSAVEGIITIDADGSISSFNPAAARMFGYEPDEVLRRNVNMLMPEPYHSEHDGYLDHHLRTGERRIIGIGREVEGRRKDGTTFPMHLSVGAFEVDGHRMFTGIAHDITEQREAEAAHEKVTLQLGQAQRLESLGQLAGGIAHDFNNILAAVGMYAEMALDAADPGGQLHEDITQIAAATEQGRGLTRQLLAFGRHDVFDLAVIDVNEVVRSVEELLRRTLGEQVVLETSLEPELSTVRADRSQLEQVLVNLAVNARDAMPDGGRLHIETSNTVIDPGFVYATPDTILGPCVRIAVSDDGQGMPAEVRERAFEPFFTTKPQGSGTGLGLATVYGIIAQAGGTVSIYSEPGIGTVFTVFVPAVDLEVDVPNIDVRSERPRGQGGTVLVVEDAEGIRALLDRVLSAHGYTVLLAPNGAIGLDIARAHAGEISLLLTDVVMPEMSGPALAATLRDEHPELRIVFMSGYTQGIIGTQGVEEGAVLLEKPFNRQQLLEAVGVVLSG
jgi:PAS domain S-box-containing protein